MAKIKEWIQGLPPGRLAAFLTAALSLVCFLALTLWCGGKISGLSDQQAAARWSKEGGCAQVSAFFSGDAGVDDFQIRSFENQLETALSEAAVTNEKENARLYVDAYSARGTITVVSEQSTLDASAVGVGGDFFFFHPLQLVSGRYFSGDELMQDFVILDEEAAWQLFGSSNIEGMSVMIGGVPHYVAGVIKRQTGRFAEEAGLGSTVVYVSCDSLLSYGASGGISCYELVAPEPVKGFVSSTLQEKFGLDEKEMLTVENSSRYSWTSALSVLLDFGVRSMQSGEIGLPYWENIARGWEDVRAAALLLQAVFLLIPAAVAAVFLIGKWKKSKITGKRIVRYLIDKKDSMESFFKVRREAE